MPEILTESFCERCGTRYTFESAAPRTAKLKGVKVLSRGLKNFVMSDDSSMDEAMAAARSDADRETISLQLDAFHKTFNFCMSCRQYTCGNCWNESDGQCLSCSPHLGHEIMPAPFPDLDATLGVRFEPEPTNGHGIDAGEGLPRFDATAWPTSDLSPAEDQAAASSRLIGEAPSEAVDPAAPFGRIGEEPPAIAPVAFLPDATVAEPRSTDALPTWPSAEDVAGGPIESPPAIVDEVREAADLPASPEIVADDPTSQPESATDLALAAEAATAAVEATRAADAVAEDATVTPEAELEPRIAAEPTGVAEATLAPEPASEYGLVGTPEPAVAPDSPVQPAETDEVVAERAAAAAAQTAALLQRFRPGQSLDDALEAFERETVPEPEASSAAPAPDMLPSIASDADLVAAAASEQVAQGTLADEVVEVAAFAVVADTARADDVEPEVVEVEVVEIAAVEAEAEPEPVVVEAIDDAAPVTDAVEAEPFVIADVVADVTQDAAAIAAEPASAAPEVDPGPKRTDDADRIAAAAALAAAAFAAAPAPAAPEPTPREDVVEQPVWQIVAPDPATEPRPAVEPPASPAVDIPTAAIEPQWPTRPTWPAEQTAPLVPTNGQGHPSPDGLESLWAASSREVHAVPASTNARPTGVQPCISCGLSLSATARFCRRCGTRQA